MPMKPAEKRKLEDVALRIRESIIETTLACGGSHLGGALSQTDILVALYYKYMKIDPKKPDWADRDRFILSKGHGGVGHAAILADLNFVEPKELKKFNKTGSPFGMHLDCLKVRGVDASTGSLGHGLGIGIGMALGARLTGQTWRVYVVMGDGEQNAGPVWEAAQAAAHYKVVNMTTFIDRNQLCIDGRTEKVMAIEPLRDKYEAFGWRVVEINGHDFQEIGDAIEQSQAEKEKPFMIIANTIKGKGVDFMEDKAPWHYAGLDDEMAKKALASLRKGAKNG